MSWASYALCFVAFFATHSIPLRPPIKARLVRVLGRRGFTALYSLLSLAMLGLLIHAAGRAPFVPLWPMTETTRHITLTGMLLVCQLLALTLGRPNPLSFGGRATGFDPARPGLIKLIRHPVLVALGLWAGLHMLVNGDLAHVIFFGVMAVFAFAGRALVERRRIRELGRAEWDRLLTRIAAAPLWHKPASWGGAALRLLIGVAAYLAIISLHPYFAGVAVV